MNWRAQGRRRGNKTGLVSLGCAEISRADALARQWRDRPLTGGAGRRDVNLSAASAMNQPSA